MSYDIRNLTQLDQAEFEKALLKPLEAFTSSAKPSEDVLYVRSDVSTAAVFCECHVPAENLISLGTTDVPLDPAEQGDYRANRDLVESHYAFSVMKEDAKAGRTFSNIVAEYATSYEAEHPIKIIGGQHRFEAIKEALADGVNQVHGLKIYFALTPEQRLDVQLISNTVIAVSTDLFDRMQETVRGPELRNWCQEVGMLGKGDDFADRRLRDTITVRLARSFIMNYWMGHKTRLRKFETTETNPILAKTGELDSEWSDFVSKNPSIWKDAGLKLAGVEFALLHRAQVAAFTKATQKKGKSVAVIENVDFAYKSLSFAIATAFAYVAGLLADNKTRLDRHYALKNEAKSDPLNTKALGKGRHKSDPENYRGLGYRTDPKERGRLVELFYLQAEKGEGIKPTIIDHAIKRHVAKLANLDVKDVE